MAEDLLTMVRSDDTRGSFIHTAPDKRKSRLLYRKESYRDSNLVSEMASGSPLTRSLDLDQIEIQNQDHLEQKLDLVLEHID